jgi:hypothetical protein
VSQQFPDHALAGRDVQKKARNLFLRDKPTMHWKISNKHYRLNLISAIILLVGLGSALVIYIASPDASDSNPGYEIVGDKVYPIVPTKTYVRNLELYGGKGLVLADDIMRWFNGLWYGKSLAVTIACVSSITAGGIFFFNNYVSFEDEKEHTG